MSARAYLSMDEFAIVFSLISTLQQNPQPTARADLLLLDHVGTCTSVTLHARLAQFFLHPLASTNAQTGGSTLEGSLLPKPVERSLKVLCGSSLFTSFSHKDYHHRDLPSGLGHPFPGLHFQLFAHIFPALHYHVWTRADVAFGEAVLCSTESIFSASPSVIEGTVWESYREHPLGQ